MAADEVLAYCAASADVLGAFLFGSRGRDVGVDERSDWDVWIVARDDDALARIDERFPYAHGAQVEIASSTLEGLRRHGAIGSRSEWARYQHAHVEVRVDKTGGELERVLGEKELLPAEHRDDVARSALGGFVNATFRSLRYGARLDATESVPYALQAIFAFAGRVRPFNCSTTTVFPSTSSFASSRGMPERTASAPRSTTGSRTSRGSAAKRNTARASGRARGTRADRSA